MFIDFDGLVLPCCFDFSRSLPLGNLSTQTFQQVFEGEPWRDIYDTFRRGEWSSKGACSRCRADHPEAVAGIARSLTGSMQGKLISLSGFVFSLTDHATRDAQGVISGSVESPDGMAIFGPYTQLAAGRYRAYHHIDVTECEGEGALELDACVEFGRQIAARRVDVCEVGNCDAGLDFELASDAAIELRVVKQGAIGYAHRGATLVRL